MPFLSSYRRLPLIAALASLVLLPALRGAVHLPPGFAVEIVADSTAVSEPIDLTFSPDGAAWVTGRAGDLWRVDPASRTTRRVGGVDTDVSGDRGLHGVALHPEFPETPHVFLAYHLTNHVEGKYRSRIARWTVAGKGDSTTLEPSSEKSLVEWDGDQAGQHVGGGLLAHPTERVLYATTGENNQNANLLKYCDDPENKAQSLHDLRGKVLRMGFDGSVPRDNPNAGNPGPLGLIYTRGHRQPWSLSFDPKVGVLLAENGGDLADDHDEVNRLVPGGNYGWPKVFGDGWLTSSRTNRVEGFTSPWFNYRRNTGASCTGAVIYRSSSKSAAYPSRYQGGLFYADFGRKTIRYAAVDPKSGRPGESEAFLQGLTAGPVALRAGPDGALYFITHGGATKASTNDAIVRIVWKP